MSYPLRFVIILHSVVFYQYDPLLPGCFLSPYDFLIMLKSKELENSMQALL